MSIALASSNLVPGKFSGSRMSQVQILSSRLTKKEKVTVGIVNFRFSQILFLSIFFSFILFFINFYYFFSLIIILIFMSSLFSKNLKIDSML